MKTLNEFIQESVINEKVLTAYDGPDYFFSGSAKQYYEKLGYTYYNKNNKPSAEDIENAYATTSNVTGDPSFGSIDGIEFTKIKDNVWQSSSPSKHVFGGTINNKQFIQMLNKSRGMWYLMLRTVNKENNKI